MHSLCVQCSIAGVHRMVLHCMMRRYDGGAQILYAFQCEACGYRWRRTNYSNVLFFNLLKKTFKRAYYLMVLKIGVRKRKEKERLRITALYVLTKVSELNADMREKIIRYAGLL